MSTSFWQRICMDYWRGLTANDVALRSHEYCCIPQLLINTVLDSTCVLGRSSHQHWGRRRGSNGKWCKNHGLCPLSSCHRYVQLMQYFTAVQLWHLNKTKLLSAWKKLRQIDSIFYLCKMVEMTISSGKCFLALCFGINLLINWVRVEPVTNWSKCFQKVITDIHYH